MLQALIAWNFGVLNILVFVLNMLVGRYCHFWWLSSHTSSETALVPTHLPKKFSENFFRLSQNGPGLGENVH